VAGAGETAAPGPDAVAPEREGVGPRGETVARRRLQRQIPSRELLCCGSNLLRVRPLKLRYLRNKSRRPLVHLVEGEGENRRRKAIVKPLQDEVRRGLLIPGIPEREWKARDHKMN
jgi:hypothetical protein